MLEVSLQEVWDSPRPGHLFQISWSDSRCGGQGLASGSQQPAEVKAEVGAGDKGAG